VGAPAGLDLLLFVGGEPIDPNDPLQQVSASVFARFANTLLPAVAWSRSPSKVRPADPAATGPPWHLGRQEIFCVNQVLEVAEKLGRSVTVVDVNRAGEQQPLVDRWVGNEDILPILVRPDGERLEGSENFSSSILRKFIRADAA